MVFCSRLAGADPVEGEVGQILASSADPDHAEDSLVSLGEAALPDMQRALTQADPARRSILEVAIFRIQNHVNPRQKVIDWMHLEGERGAWSGHPQHVEDAALSRVFRGYLFYVARFPQYPVGRPIPPGLGVSNVFSLDASGHVEYLRDPDALRTFFSSHLPAVNDSDTAVVVTRAWLRLSLEYSQDGMFHFSIADESLQARRSQGTIEASGKAVVDTRGGNSGEVSARLVFDGGGRLADVQETRKVHAGIRPICQATKLLDPDPIVRRMAEQDILVMGRSCREYLREQRVQASPPLQQAIDAIWDRILQEDLSR